MENISKEYDAIVAELAERAELVAKDEGGDIDDAIRRALDDGFYYTDDQAYVLAWCVEQHIVEYGREVDWGAVEENLIDDIKKELEK